MSLLNINFAVLAYQDLTSTTQPSIRLADMKWSLLGMPTSNFRNLPIHLGPGESLTVATTARTLTYSGSTSFAVTAQGDRMRIKANLGQRTPRAYGDASTQWTITRSGTVTRAKATGGLMPTFSSVQAGDYVYFGPDFSPINQGEFLIQKVGADYIEIVADIGVEEATTAKLNIYSSGPVQKGDILDISSTAFAYMNRGQFPVVLATDEMIEVLNADVFPETVSGVSAGLSIYAFAYKWMMLAVDQRVTIGLNGQSAASSPLEVEPPVEGDIIKSPGLFIKRGKAFEVQIYNPSHKAASGFLILAE